jgi:hypothetical protein
MPELIKVFIVKSLYGSVFLWRDDRFHALAFGLIDDGIAVVAFIGDQIVSAHAFDQVRSLCAIRCCTLRDKDSDRHTMRIHGQMYFGVEPPFVRLMS